jgi:hypothetical protein
MGFPRNGWVRAARGGVVPGVAAAALSTATLAARGRVETGSAVAPANATSQWIWGDAAAGQDRPSLKYTALGLLVHQAAALLWSTLYERVVPDRHGHRGPARAVAAGVGVAALAALVDYTVTPRRLRPGYEKRVSLGSLVAVYGAFAVGLALSDVLSSRSAVTRPADPPGGGGPLSR